MLFSTVVGYNMARSYSGCISNLCRVEWKDEASIATRRHLFAEDASKKHAKQRKPQTAARCRLNSVFYWLPLLLLLSLLLLLLVLAFCWRPGDCWPAM